MGWVVASRTRQETPANSVAEQHVMSVQTAAPLTDGRRFLEPHVCSVMYMDDTHRGGMCAFV